MINFIKVIFDFFLRLLSGFIHRVAGLYMSSIPSRIRSSHSKIPIIKSVELNGVSFSFFSNSSDALYRHTLANFTYFEPNTIKLFQQVLRAQDSGLFIDVGSHSGLFGVVAMKLDWETIFCEPNPKLTKNIQNNIRLNRNMNSKSELLCFALGDEINTAQMHFGSLEDSAVSTLLEIHLDKRLKYKTDVKQTTLDNLKMAPRVIKIDVEGYEMQVLKGGSYTLRTHKPIIFMEALTDVALKNQSKYLFSLGYGEPTVCGKHTHDARNFIWRPIQ